ncbi:MAG: hypothetical protein EOP83_24615 [Verrucomicrobiaceae bacterium]|nr:MAG: hypothetical protein EOP83_24615 [Verrucomicrobiaceae bacterium]
MKSIKPPQKVDFAKARNTLFLAGAIDNGAADPWQKQIEEALADRDVTILNPRRDDWDPTWEASTNNKSFVEQVNWELDGMENAETILFYFPANSKAPITLLELGLYGTPQKGVIFCPDAFWRSGNVQIVAKRRGVPLYKDHNEFVEAIIGLFPAAP